jgi:AcrR family transcriptional regulator
MTRAAPDVPARTAAQPGRSRGRPRDAHVDDAVLQATIQLLAEVGLHGTTIAAVAERAGVARATVYLRWPTHDTLIAAAGRYAMRRPPYALTGDLATDLLEGSAYATRIFSEPAVLAILPELMRAVLAQPPALDFDTLSPNRVRFSDEYRAFAAAQGFRTDLAPETAFDMMLGAHISHVLATSHGASPEFAERIANVILAGLRAPENRRAGPEGPAREEERS